MTNNFYEYRGAIHVHSDLSDGSSPPREIVEIAESVGLDFLIFNDHYHMSGGLNLSHQGYHGTVLALVGAEIGYRRNHYLAFNCRRLTLGGGESAQQVIDEVKRAGGFGAIAHPFDRGAELPAAAEAFPWVDWEVERFNAIEVWNLLTDFKSDLSGIAQAYYYLKRPEAKLIGPDADTIELYDRLTLKNRVVAIGGVDAHDQIVRAGPFRVRVFDYKTSFSSLSNHILAVEKLTGIASEDADLIYQALAEGRLFIVNHLLGDGSGFEFSYLNSSREIFPLGSRTTFAPGGMITVSAPGWSRLEIYRNGHRVASKTGMVIEYSPPTPGVYRAVARRRRGGKMRCWIFSNPIYLSAGNMPSDTNLRFEENLPKDGHKSRPAGKIIPIFDKSNEEK